MPTLVQLQYALAVEKHRHFGKAARACHVSQPTLSQQLQKLEDEIGVILFDRQKKPVLPTPEGARFLEQARSVLREQQKLTHLTSQLKSGEVSGELRLAVIPTVASDLLPLFLKPFTRAHPDVNLFIEEMKTETILQELGADRLDGAILATPLEGADVKVHPLYYESFWVYLSARHPLLARREIRRTDLDAGELWLLQDGHCFKDQVVNFCVLPKARDSTHKNVHFRSGSLDTLRRLVKGGGGYTLLPALMASSLPEAERRAHVRPFQAPVPTREISLIYRRDHWKLAILRALEYVIAKNLPESVRGGPSRTMRVLEVS